MPEPTPRILIIDNDEELLRAIAARLEHNDYECATASSGAQGLSIFADEPVDLVITDLNMPGGDGVAVVEEIRRSSAVPIIVITGFSTDYRERLRHLAHVSCLRKPFDTAVLLELIETELALAEA
ncbi:MAG: response regulator [Phycisphaerales bacterium]|nr:response regulator [Phycisphaerae bacterium]NNF43427.1 response regulator [Phycisphaerales bacterium]NNM24951.1 response regulator [Phycisphaerales bacterium]